MINSLKNFDTRFYQNNFRGDLESESVFSFVEKFSYVCFSAPHSTASFRKSCTKPSDLFTGAICLHLSQILGFSAIVRNKYTDNKYLINEFVFEHNLEQHYFIDVHGMSAEREFEMAIGIGESMEAEYAKELEFIKKSAQKYGISYCINHEDYTGRFGFTGKLQKRTGKNNILQIEFRKDMRDFYNHPEIILVKTLPFLSELAVFVEKNIKYQRP